MLRSRSSLAVFVGSISFAFGCAQGEPVTADPDPRKITNTEQQPTEPSDPVPEKPKPSNPDEASAPEVLSVSPNSAVVGSVGPSIVVTGNNFVPRSIVQLDGAPLATSFVSGTELRAVIPSNKLTSVGVLRISVGTAPPGGGASKEISFTVENPVPQLTVLAPLSVLAGSGATQLSVSGASFVPGAKIVFGATSLTTTFTSGTQLDASIPASLLTTSGSTPVTVVNPAPGGGTSAAIAFTTSNPSATIKTINPSAAFVGSAAFEMTVNGSGFVTGSTVSFNGVTVPTTVASASKLLAQVPASSLIAASDVPVTVQNPPPGGGLSTPVVFRVEYPSPSASALSPKTVSAGSSSVEVTVTGIGFFATTQITFDNAPAPTTYMDATHVKATLPAAQLATAGTISVRVVNPSPGGGTSAALAFTITNASPSVTSLSPSFVPPGSTERVVTVTGAGFVPASLVKGNGQVLTTSYVNSTRLTATIPASLLATRGKVAITVTNPAPGGGTTQNAYVDVGCSNASSEVVPLTSLGATYSFGTNFTAAALESRLQAGTCPLSSLLTSSQQPGRYLLVQNETGASATLSAWADCTNDDKGDAFLTFYRRATLPADDTERLACASVVSEGSGGVGKYASPESGASYWCPGLTKANGGGLSLALCEVAVVHIQPYNHQSTTFTPPPTLRVRAE